MPSTFQSNGLWLMNYEMEVLKNQDEAADDVYEPFDELRPTNSTCESFLRKLHKRSCPVPKSSFLRDARLRRGLKVWYASGCAISEPVGAVALKSA